jgi:hypothetical protein
LILSAEVVMPSNGRGWRGLVVLVILLAAVGCGSTSMTAVSGTVTFDGTPIEKGTISFYPVDRKSVSTGGSIVNGAYKVDVPPGTMKVHISMGTIIGYKELYEKGKSDKRPLTSEVLPPKYSDMQKTELTLDVAGGSMQKDWNLTSK